ncbi:MAG: bifunctional 5,10-methylenetetrahydrofolate dehydrogenase/5,10-methenyltetrahydrofolate cyclohydrolase [Patescibacteria group bacterium]|nr:bifunctional 5,10-methylenetetrahydrofolate dehydrogenase/5,10-methenyltetrahydrofolate cyclohydrolase [Patescibacteria group bacterium]
MQIDGREIAQKLLSDIKKRVEKLAVNNVFPGLAIILVGEDPASKTYVTQKIKKATEVGIKTILVNLNTGSESKLITQLEENLTKLNNDKSVHGIIVQRPLPKYIDQQLITDSVLPEKDVDGLRSDSKFEMPLGLAVLEILEKIFEKNRPRANFLEWLKPKKITVLGKGITGGKPVADILRKNGANPNIIDSKTSDPDSVIKNSDLVISAVGKERLLNSSNVKKNSILISIGMHKALDGKLHGDYEEEEIKDIVSFYTPTPGGVGPVNVAMLLKNVVLASKNSTL